MVTIQEMHHMEAVVSMYNLNKGIVYKERWDQILSWTIEQLEREYNRIKEENMDVPILPIRAKNQCNKGEE